jgi:serine/threonine-protein kinase
LLSGTVPFPLNNKGEIGRNGVMISHMESLPPNLLLLRQQAMPDSWSNEKKEREMQVPGWLIKMIYTCLEKEPLKRFRNGIELQEFIHSGIIAEENKKELNFPRVDTTKNQVEELELREQLQRMEQQSVKKDKLIEELQYQVKIKDDEIYQFQYSQHFNTKPKGVSKGAFFFLLVAALGLAAFAGYNSFLLPADTVVSAVKPADQKTVSPPDSLAIADKKISKKTKAIPKKDISLPLDNTAVVKHPAKPNNTVNPVKNKWVPKKEYRIIHTAYIHRMPDEHTKGNLYIIPGDEAVVKAINEKNEFIYVSFIDSDGKAMNGWLLKKDLLQVK